MGTNLFVYGGIGLLLLLAWVVLLWEVFVGARGTRSLDSQSVWVVLLVVTITVVYYWYHLLRLAGETSWLSSWM